MATRPWHLGNTTVRSPFRLRDGLIALSNSSLQGNLRGKSQEIALRQLLGKNGIVELGEDTTYSVGRKWRSALNKLGFLYPEVPAGAGIIQDDLGPIDTITPNGWRLIRSETVPAMQECFLRALAAYFIPSTLEKKYDFSVFYPLRHTLAVMLELEKNAGDSQLNFIEMALIVQLTSNDRNVADIVNEIQDLRDRRMKSTNKKQFDGHQRENLANLYSYASQTFNDYADTNFRYLKATGLLQSKGRGLSLISEKHVFIKKLVEDATVPETGMAYLKALCNGAILPTDNKDAALEVLSDLLTQLKHRNIPFDVKNKPLDNPANIAIVRHEIEELLSRINEEEYANRQIDEWEEIFVYMDLIRHRRQGGALPNGEEVRLPLAEAAAYFEWILWRSFLAIDSLENKPYEARRFKIDQDFLPIGTAPGGGPDMIFEFENYVIVVEVTLTDNSRQESLEGESVRRHVADLMAHHKASANKPVYGLFIAKQIDSNTAETFRKAVWFDRDNIKMDLNIVPITIGQFQEIFKSLLQKRPIRVNLIREIIDQCTRLRSQHEGPTWKQEIVKTISRMIDA